MSLFKDLFNYREFLKTSIRKEFRGKYKKSFLGILWSFIKKNYYYVLGLSCIQLGR